LEAHRLPHAGEHFAPTTFTVPNITHFVDVVGSAVADMAVMATKHALEVAKRTASFVPPIGIHRLEWVDRGSPLGHDFVVREGEIRVETAVKGLKPMLGSPPSLAAALTAMVMKELESSQTFPVLVLFLVNKTARSIRIPCSGAGTFTTEHLEGVLIQGVQPSTRNVVGWKTKRRRMSEDIREARNLQRSVDIVGHREQHRTHRVPEGEAVVVRPAVNTNGLT